MADELDDKKKHNNITNAEISPVRKYCNIYGQTQIQSVALNYLMEGQTLLHPLNLFVNSNNDDDTVYKLQPWHLVNHLFEEGKLHNLNYMIPSHYTKDGRPQFTMVPGLPYAPSFLKD